jgi:hypothetical protein
MHSHTQRRYWPVGIVAFAMAILLSATVAQAQSQDKRNFAGVEFFGQGLLLTGNYERYVKRVGVGVGFAAWHIDETVVIVPVYASFRPIGHTHSLYLSAGATFTNQPFQAFAPSKIAYGMGSIGYEHVSKSGLVLRPTYSVLIARGESLLWPGFLIGYRF